MPPRPDMAAGAADAPVPDVVRLVDALVRSLYPLSPDAPQSDAKLLTLRRRCLRILESRIGAAAAQSETMVIDATKKLFLRQYQSSDRALQFSALAHRLQSSSSLSRKWAVLHFLHTVGVQVAQTDDSAIEIPLGSLSSLPLLSAIQPAVAPDAFPITAGPSRASSFYTTTSTAAAPGGGPRSMNDTTIPSGGVGLSSTFDPALDDDTHPRINTSHELPEPVLVHDLLYVLQGLDGRLMKWDSATSQYELDPSAGIPRPTRDLMHKISELGFIYKQVASYLEETRQAAGAPSSNPAADPAATVPAPRAIGLVEQSFAAALQAELTQYFRLVALLSATASRGTLTLRRLWLWSVEPLHRLRVMSAMVASARGLHGGSLAGVVHSYAHHGDPALERFVQTVLRAMCAPLFAMIRRWVYEGDLVDPHKEFFVAASSGVGDDDENWWKLKYRLRGEMVPGFVDRVLARKILLIGKSLNFLRFRMKDASWVAHRAAAGAREATVIEYGDLVAFEHSIDHAAKITTERLVDRMFHEYGLMDHLGALKRYLLMGQGDFVQCLMESIGKDLDKPAPTLYRHHLTGTLEQAIRSSNAQFDNQDVLRRLDVRLLASAPGDTGWDVFSLDYAVSSPINTVITAQAMSRYHQLFKFMWSVKRAATALEQAWRGHLADARRYLGRERSTLAFLDDDADELQATFAVYHRAWGEMAHFVHQVQYYIMFEVVECTWDEFLVELQKKTDPAVTATTSATGAGGTAASAPATPGRARQPPLELDAIIVAHNRFINKIAQRGLLIAVGKDGTREAGSAFSFDKVFPAVHQLCAAREQMVEYAQWKARQPSATAGARDQENSWRGPSDLAAGLTDKYRGRPGRSIAEIRSMVEDARSTFKVQIGELLYQLSTDQDDTKRNLKVRLNFNEYYADASEPRSEGLISSGGGGGDSFRYAQ
ncbi:Spc98 family-domain-containing protein [Blastocladiella britannica]|nr:Spc98 family-domain-containing protein [Blastocladiella britannica]